MIQTVVAIVLVVIHLIVCLVLWTLMKLDVIEVRGHVLPFMVLVPLWGPVTAVFVALRARIYGDRHRPATLEMLRVNDEVHRSLLVSGGDDVDETIPLEEALVVNSPAERRRIMLSLLTGDPEGYLSLLQAASLNDDTEVAHYAATAVANISKESDLKLQALERAFKADPSDASALDAYSDYLHEYLDSGLVEGRAADIQRRQYLSLLKRRYRREGTFEIGCELCRAMLDAGDIDDAEELATSLTTERSDSKDAWMLKFDCAVARRDREAVNGVLDAIDRAHVYLGAVERERLAFWRTADDSQMDKGEDAA